MKSTNILTIVVLFQVIIFLTSTLKKGIFQRILRDNPVAASHYVQYLYSKQYINELVDTLEYVHIIKCSTFK